MRSLITELHQEGFPISMLYPATWPLYRLVGYEQAGHRFTVKLNLPGLELREKIAPRALPRLTPLDKVKDRTEIVACYNKFAKNHNGFLDRSAYMWEIVLNATEPLDCFAMWGPGGTLLGYILLKVERLTEQLHCKLTIVDMAFLTPAAAQAIILFLKGFAPLGLEATFTANLSHPLLSYLREAAYTATVDHVWAIRVLNVAKALVARGYNPALTHSFSMHVTDNLLPSNNGVYTVVLKGGRATVNHARSSDLPSNCIELNVSTLASLYSGLATCEQLAEQGLVSGPLTAFAAVNSAFAGSPPATPDYF